MSDMVILVFDLFSIRKLCSSKLVVCFSACVQRCWRVKCLVVGPGGVGGCDIEYFEVVAHYTGQWWKILKNTCFAKITSSISKQLPFKPLQVLKHRYKRYFENFFLEKSIWKSDFPTVLGIFSSLNTDCTWLLRKLASASQCCRSSHIVCIETS